MWLVQFFQFLPKLFVFPLLKSRLKILPKVTTIYIYTFFIHAYIYTSIHSYIHPNKHISHGKKALQFLSHRYERIKTNQSKVLGYKPNRTSASNWNGCSHILSSRNWCSVLIFSKCHVTRWRHRNEGHRRSVGPVPQILQRRSLPKRVSGFTHWLHIEIRNRIKQFVGPICFLFNMGQSRHVFRLRFGLFLIIITNFKFQYFKFKKA